MSFATAGSCDAPRHTPASTRSRFKNFVCYSPACMVAVGLMVRLLCIAVGHLQHRDLAGWKAFEMVNIGYSLTEGQGFASPFGGSTGPTTWTAPLYPWIISLTFRALGIFSDHAALALLSFNSVFSALTSWTIYRISCRVFGDKAVAAWSGWAWALFPYAVYYSVTWIWDTTLSTFLLSLLFMFTLEMEHDERLWPWFRYAVLWGLVALSNTSIVAWLPFSGCWLAYRLHRAGKRFLRPVLFSALVFWMVITPWIVRNYVVFDKLIFIRGDLGSELHTGNNPLATGTWISAYRAGNNTLLYMRYRALGEVAYDAEQGRLARAWIAENPRRFLILCGRRVFYFWFGLPEPWLQHFRLLYVCLTPLALGGLLLAGRGRLPGVFLFASLLAAYPLVYYITFPTDRYHHVIEPELLVLAVWLLACLMRTTDPQASLSKTRGSAA